MCTNARLTNPGKCCMLPYFPVCLFCGLLWVQLLPLEEELRRCCREQQEAQLRGRQLEQRAEELEERKAAAVEERERQVKLMEVNISATEEMKGVLQRFNREIVLTFRMGQNNGSLISSWIRYSLTGHFYKSVVSKSKMNSQTKLQRTHMFTGWVITMISKLNIK